MYNIRRNVGIELECSADRYYSIGSPYWENGRDYSVRRCGHEFRFNKPYSGQDVVTAVDAITSWMKTTGFEVHGVGAGFHLHLDYSGVAHKASGFINIADSIYPYLSTKFGQARKDNDYCNNTDGIYSRYRWIHCANIHYNRRQTVEIRLHHGTKTASKILTWCELWSELSLQCDAGNIGIVRTKKQYNNIIRSLNISTKTKNRFLCLS